MNSGQRGSLTTSCFVCVLSALVPVLCLAETYYVSNDGNDSHAGTSEQTSWQTLSRLADTLQWGDELYLKRGDTFRDSLVLDWNQGNITIGAYGNSTDPRPVVNGATLIAGWTLHSGSIYVADVSERIEHLFVDGAIMTIARYPNSGWLRKTTGSRNADTSEIYMATNDLDGHPRQATDYWIGANFRWRRWSWWFETHRILDDDGAGNLTLSGENAVKSRDHLADPGWGFYLDNKFEELDSAGEWFLDTAAMKVYLHAPDGGDPTDLTVEGSCREKGIAHKGGSVSDICFRYQTKNGLNVGSPTQTTRCLFEFIGDQAFSIAWDVGGSTLSHSMFRNNLNFGIVWNENPASVSTSVIEYDTILNTAMIPAYGSTEEWQSAALYLSNGTGVTVRRNIIDSVGYSGISLGSDGNIIEYNLIKNCLQTLNDGAGIYANCSHNIIRNNIVMHSLGNLESSGPWFCLGQGIWLEFLGDFGYSRVENNTSAYNGRNGLFLLNEFQDTIVNNVFFNNDSAQFFLGGLETNEETGRVDNPPQLHTIRNNVLCAGASTQVALIVQTDADFGYGDIDSNYYLNPYGDNVLAESIAWGGISGYTSIADWQSTYAWADQNAREDVVKIQGPSTTGAPELFLNDTYDQMSFDVGTGLYTDLDGNAVDDSITLEAFASRILIHTGVAGASRHSRRSIGDLLQVTSRAGIPLRITVPSGHKGDLSIRICTAHGRQVFSHVHRINGAEEATVDWDGATGGSVRAAPGVYLCRVSARFGKATVARVARLVVP